MTDAVPEILDCVTAIQTGDLEQIREYILRRNVVVPTAKDRDDCSLLHWAAINNRCTIASFLIERGASPSVSGGILNESPLQWALRRNFYGMVRLLAACGADLSHVSAEGVDALHMACRMGDLNMIFLLLHLGANPNSVDGNGDTPILWLVQHEKGRKLLYPLQLLIHFGGDVSCRNANTGDNALHLAVRSSDWPRRAAFLIHQSGYPRGIVLAANKSGITAFKQAFNPRDAQLISFFYQGMMFNAGPYHTATALCALSVVSLFLFLVSAGLIYGSILFAVTYFVFWRNLSQWHIVDHRSRVNFGIFWGYIICTFLTLEWHLGYYISDFQRYSIIVWLSATAFLLLRTHMTKPQYASSTDKVEIIERICKSSHADGPEEEEAAILHHEKPSISLEKHLELLRNRRRREAPRLCPVCLVDLRHCRSASHCNCCNACVVDADEHYDFIANCVGRGNRRLYCLLLLVGAIAYANIAATSLWVHKYAICPSARGILWNYLAVEWCVLWSVPASFMITIPAIFLSMNFMGMFGEQMMFIGADATVRNIKRNRADLRPAGITVNKVLRKLEIFWKTGNYTVRTHKLKATAVPTTSSGTDAHTESSSSLPLSAHTTDVTALRGTVSSTSAAVVVMGEVLLNSTSSTSRRDFVKDGDKDDDDDDVEANKASTSQSNRRRRDDETLTARSPMRKIPNTSNDDDYETVALLPGTLERKYSTIGDDENAPDDGVADSSSDSDNEEDDDEVTDVFPQQRGFKKMLSSYMKKHKKHSKHHQHEAATRDKTKKDCQHCNDSSCDGAGLVSNNVIETMPVQIAALDRV